MKVIKQRLSRKILAILTLALTLPMLIISYISANHMANDLIHQMTLFGDVLANSVYGAIKYPMSVGDSTAVTNQLLDMELEDIEIYINNNEQDIIYSTKKNLIGAKNPYTSNDQTVGKHLNEFQTTTSEGKFTFEKVINDQKFLNIVQVISNQEECYRCHGSTKKILGNIMVAMATDKTYQTIRSHTAKNILFALAGICIIIAITYALLIQSLSSPVKKLAKDMRDLPAKLLNKESLPQVSTRMDEIGDLEKSFNQMAKDLKEKREIIEFANNELTNANKELEAFAYSVSHDLRAPLRNIDGFSKILLEEYGDKLDEKGKHYLTRVRNGTLKMSELIDDILTLSRAGRQELRLHKTNANLLINDVLRDFTEDIKHRDITVKVGQLPEIFCDFTLIRSVFSNLISNAVKYTHSVKEPKILIDFNKDKKAIYVNDNGIGFDMQYHDKIYQVFQRLQLPEEYEGTGIGLAIAKRIMDRHHGSIWAESIAGQGATFYVKLPLIDSA